MRKSSILALIACLSLAGCQFSPVQKGGLIGGAAGAAVGGVWASQAGALTALEGAGVGAATGAAVGAVGADAMEKKKEKAASQSDEDIAEMQAEMEGLKNETDVKTKRIEELEDQLDELREQLKRQPKPDEVSMAPAPAPALAPAQAPMSDDEVRDLQKAVSGEVEVGRSDKGITLTFVSEVLFAPGRASLAKTGTETLSKAVDPVRQRYPNNEINIEGHTDNVCIKHSGYPSNWELSTERAASVLHFLIDNEGFRPDLLSITGFGDTRPVAPNDTALGRRLNRRAVLVILPDVKYQKEHLSY